MAAEGSLVCNVYTSDAKIPVQNAIVTVTQKTPAGQTHLIATRLTDISGKTAPIIIETPPLADTTSPGTAHGWTSVDITVDHPGYLRTIVEDAQIFPQTRTLQMLELIPLPLNSARWNESEFFMVPSQNL